MLLPFSPLVWAAGREGMDLGSLRMVSPVAHPCFGQPPCVPLLVFPWEQLNSWALLSLLLLPVPQVSRLLLSVPFWLSPDGVTAAGLPMSSFPHWGASYEELLCCFLRDFGEILANGRNSNTEHASSDALDPQAVAILKVMPEREACEFFIGARCQRMGSAKGLSRAGHLAFQGVG